MSKRVLVNPAFYIPAMYVDLDDGEEICPDCHGKGEVTHIYCDPGPNIRGTCWTCDGTGKIHHCRACGNRVSGGIILRRMQADLDGLCNECFLKRHRANIEVPNQHAEE